MRHVKPNPLELCKSLVHNGFMNIQGHTLAIRDYPQLRLIAWNRREGDVITEEEAFGLYETNWRYVNEYDLDDRERAMIHRLTQEYGKGVMNV